ncbi:MAG TPA: PBP1A family penicillin-binding protein [Chthoniobacterales bacterium]
MSKPIHPRVARIRPWLFGSALVGLLSLAVVFCCFLFWSLRFDLRDVGRIPERSWIFDMDGNLYTRLYGENRVLVDPGKVSPWFKEALLAREDARFYQHHGVDVVGIGRALVRNLTHLSVREGASTITQQLARNSFPLGGRNLSRKILEAFVAVRIERAYNKEQILGFYLNRIYFGSGYYGLETAAQAYFGKTSGELTLPEAALLAGLIRSPNRYSPLHNPTGATAQRNEVLERMVELKMILPADAQQSREMPLHLANRRAVAPQQNYAMDALYRELQGLMSQDQIDGGGLRIYTTLDPALQAATEEAVETTLKQVESKPGYPHPTKAQFAAQPHEPDAFTNYLQGAALAMDNRSGAVRALVGGRDYKESKYNRALQANRQVGSTFKPFVYAAAYARGMMPGASINDGPIGRGEIAEAPDWSPANSDRNFGGMRPARDGLIFSRNTMTVRVGELATLDRVRALGLAAKFAPDIPKVPSTYLGAFESNLREVTAAYGAMAARGVRREPYLVERIDDVDGKILYQAHPAQQQVLTPAVAWMVAQTLRGVIERGTAASAKSLGLERYAAGKTGTTDDYKDAWFLGFTNSLTCGVWVGFDKPETIQARGYGATLALPIWVKVIEKASRQKYPDGEFAPPEPLVRAKVCAVSNELATSACETAGTAYDVMLPQSMYPQRSCPTHVDVPRPTRPEPAAEDRDTLAKRVFRSFQHLFGG